MTSTLRKVGKGLRLLFDRGTWADVRRESRGASIHHPATNPEIAVVDEDSNAGLRCVQVGMYRYWVPMSMDWTSFGMLYPEVFDHSHPHYYECDSCQIHTDDIVIDAGASEGLFTRFALERGAKVIAIEPFGPMAEGLRRTFAAEIAEGRVLIEQSAIADRPGRVRLVLLDPAQPWGAMLSEEAAENLDDMVEQTTVDAVVERSGWGRCDFLKMDVEGVERSAVQGAAGTLRRDRPRLSIAVYHHATGFVDIRDDLRRMGLPYVVRGKGLNRRGVVFIPTILHAWPTVS